MTIESPDRKRYTPMYRSDQRRGRVRHPSSQVYDEFCRRHRQHSFLSVRSVGSNLEPEKLDELTECASGNAVVTALGET